MKNLLFIAVDICAFAAQCVALMLLWGLLVAPSFGLQPLSYGQVVAASMFVRLAAFKVSSAPAEEVVSVANAIARLVVFATLAALFYLVDQVM